MAFITEYGQVITFFERNPLKNLVPIPCQKLKYSKKDLARFLENSRLRYKELPKRPDKYTSKAYKLECAYTYYEISGQGNKGYSYGFDFYGDLVGFSPISIKSPVPEGEWHLTEIY